MGQVIRAVSVLMFGAVLTDLNGRPCVDGLMLLCPMKRLRLRHGTAHRIKRETYISLTLLMPETMICLPATSIVTVLKQHTKDHTME